MFILASAVESAGDRLPGYAAAELYQEHRIALGLRADERDFASPYHWAAFGYTGV